MLGSMTTCFANGLVAFVAHDYVVGIGIETVKAEGSGGIGVGALHRSAAHFERHQYSLRGNVAARYAHVTDDRAQSLLGVDRN